MSDTVVAHNILNQSEGEAEYVCNFCLKLTEVVAERIELTEGCCWLDAVAQAYGMKLLRKKENTEYKVKVTSGSGRREGKERVSSWVVVLIWTVSAGGETPGVDYFWMAGIICSLKLCHCFIFCCCFVVSLFRRFVVLSFRRFVVSLFCRFVVLLFCCFVVLLFRCFVVLLLCCFFIFTS